MWKTYRSRKLIDLKSFFINSSASGVFALSSGHWSYCESKLKESLAPTQYNTWIKPLKIVETETNIELIAPNRFVLDWVQENYAEKISELLNSFEQSRPKRLSLKTQETQQSIQITEKANKSSTAHQVKKTNVETSSINYQSNI
ncbi:MAG: DnaA N-terminal domain-containing protein, partial [Kangiellaceae bacterium]|nr:DnaA N-terminal domain-containing protein [Kangiellaceae bacterium]